MVLVFFLKFFFRNLPDLMTTIALHQPRVALLVGQIVKYAEKEK